MIKYLKIQYRLLVCLTSFTFFLEILKKKKKKKKKSSENDQLTGHFQNFFINFFSSPDPKSEKKIPVNQLIKKSGVTLLFQLERAYGGVVKVTANGTGKAMLQLSASVNVQYPWLMKQTDNGIIFYNIWMQNIKFSGRVFDLELCLQ